MIWERQLKETSKAYKAFCEYRDLGSDRSLSKLTQELDVSKTHLGNWSSKYNWVERVEAFDDYIEARVRDSNETAIVEMRTRHARQSHELQDALALPLQVLNRKIEEDSDLNELDKLKIHELIGLLTQSAKCLKQLTEIEREARGLPSSSNKMEVTGTFRDKVDILKELCDNMSPEQKEGILNASEDD